MPPETENGNAARAADAPPWANVDPWKIVGELQKRLAAQDTEMAAMRLYIDQLHAALQVAAQATPEPAPSEP